jgi:hypothetical protein
MDWLKSKYGEHKTARVIKQEEERHRKEQQERRNQLEVEKSLQQYEERMLKQKKKAEENQKYANTHGYDALERKREQNAQKVFDSMYTPYFEEEQDERRRKQERIFKKHHVNELPGSRYSLYPLEPLNPNQMLTGAKPSNNRSMKHVVNDSINWNHVRRGGRTRKYPKRMSQRRTHLGRLSHLTRKHR